MAKYLKEESLCSKCEIKYPTRDLTYCPECGTKLRKNGKRSPHAARHHNEMRKLRSRGIT